MADKPLDPAGEIDRYRHYLSLLARTHLKDGLRGKVDLSGIVQQTLLEAHQALERLGSEPAERRLAYLRQMLANNLKDEVRKLGTAARDVSRERSLEAALDASSAKLENWLAADQSSPSQRAERNEDLLRLADGLASLPDDQQRAVELHHLQGWPLAKIAEEMAKSKGAVAALLFRGLQKLREFLKEPRTQ